MSDGPAFRRAIILRGVAGRVDADLEDDFHSFGLSMSHDGLAITRVAARASRYPWATCCEAPAALAALEGAPIAANPSWLFRHADPRVHCTHLFELAALASAHAARGAGQRLFELEVSDPEDGSRTARLFVDGILAVDWRLRGDAIVSPASEAGRTLRDFTSRELVQMDAERAEQLLLLRRAAQTSRGRQIGVDAFASAAAMRGPAHCYSLQPRISLRATRCFGSVRDWPDRLSLRLAVTDTPHL